METLFDRITTPPKVQKLQRTLYRKAKAEPGYRFYSLYGELLRRDVLETAMSAVASNAGAAGVDGQECSAYTRSDEAWAQLAGPVAGRIANQDVSAQSGAAGAHSQRRREDPALGHPDGEFILHLTQQSFGFVLG